MILPAVEVKDRMWKRLKLEIVDYLSNLIYKPLLDVIKEQTSETVKLNTADTTEAALIKKIQNGSIIYDGARFTGKFDSKTSKAIKDMGGSWEPSTKSFRLSPTKLTPSIKGAVSSSKAKLKELHDSMKKVLETTDAIADEAIDDMDISDGVEYVVQQLQDQTIKALEEKAKIPSEVITGSQAVGVEYTLTYGQRTAIKKEFTNNMNLHIKEWSHEHIRTLREDVQENAMGGYRYTNLKKLLQTRYETTEKKAEFLARQETSLFMASFRRNRFTEAGIEYYRWDTSHDTSYDVRVRKEHKRLNGRIFKFGDPPISDDATGRRREPGEDYGCRCRASGITDKVWYVNGEYKIVK